MGGGEKQTAAFYRQAIDAAEDAVLLVDVYKEKDKTTKIVVFYKFTLLPQRENNLCPHSE